jgi:replication factor C subunit 1
MECNLTPTPKWRKFLSLLTSSLLNPLYISSVKSGSRPSKPTAKVSSNPSNNKQEASRKRKSNALLISSEEEEEEAAAPPRKKPALAKPIAASTRPATVQPQKSTKTKSGIRLDTSNEESSVENPAPPKKPVIKKPTTSSAKAEPKVKEVKKETTEETKPAKPKYVSYMPSLPVYLTKNDSFAAIAARRAAGPAAPGSKEIPYGEPNCLAGLTFVFTGELESLSRGEAQDLAKRYGGCVKLLTVFWLPFLTVH